MFAYTPDEIFEIAEGIERNGTQFYRQAAALAQQESHRQLFTTLAEVEEAHRHRFADLRAQLRTNQAMPPLPDDEEQGQYLQAVADAHVFTMGARDLDIFLHQAAPIDILTFAENCEKESIVFYLMVREIVHASDARTVLDVVLHEELEHIRQLRQEKSALNCYPHTQEGGRHA